MKNQENMTSRQRVTEAINHRVPDRVPIDLGMYTASGISVFAYQNLREYLGFPIDHIEVHECVQLLPRVETDILERLHCDCILLNPSKEDLIPWTPREGYTFLTPPEFQPKRNEKGEWIVQKGRQSMRMPAEGYFFDGDWITFQDIWEENTCGAIEPLLPCLIEAGIDIINPVQISASGMDALSLKKKYGNDLVFWGGGVDTQHILGMQPEDIVRENVRAQITAFKPGGGYVFNPVHNIMGNVAPQQILAVYDEAYRQSFYTDPIQKEED